LRNVVLYILLSNSTIGPYPKWSSEENYIKRKFNLNLPNLPNLPSQEGLIRMQNQEASNMEAFKKKAPVPPV
jgi:hypothetical protein